MNYYDVTYLYVFYTPLFLVSQVNWTMETANIP